MVRNWNGAASARRGGVPSRRPLKLRRNNRFLLEALEERVVLSVDLSKFGGFLPATIGQFQTGVTAHAYRAGLPLLGDLAKDAGVSGNPFRFLDRIQQDLSAGLSGMTAATTEAEFISRVQLSLASPAVNGLGAPLTVSVTRAPGDGDPLAPETNSVTYAIAIAPAAGQSLTKDVALAADLALPGLGMGLSSPAADLALKTSFALNFRVSLNSAGVAAVDLSQGHPSLAVNGSAVLAAGSKLKGSVGLLSFEATAKPGAGLTNLGYNVDLSTFASTVTFAAQLPLTLTASFGGSAINPTVTTDFDLSWTESAPINADVGLIGALGGAGGGPSASFDNIRMSVKDGFLDGLVGPILENIQVFTKPIEPIVEMLSYKPLESFGGDQTTILKLLSYTGFISGDAIPYFDAVTNIVKLTETLGSLNSGELRLGDFKLTDVRQASSNITGAHKLDVMGQLSSQNSSFYDALMKVNDDKAAPDSAAGQPGLNLKLLSDPMLFFQLFTGAAAATTDLFTFTLPDMELGASTGEITLFTIPAPPPLTPFANARFWIKGGVGMRGHLSLGFDATGLYEFRSDPAHPDKVFKGFYVNTVEPLLTIAGYDSATGTVGGPLASIGATVSVGTNVVEHLASVVGVRPPSWLVDAINKSLPIQVEAAINAHVDLGGVLEVKLNGSDSKFRLSDLGAGGCIFQPSGFVDLGVAVDGKLTIKADVPVLVDVVESFVNWLGKTFSRVVGQEWEDQHFEKEYERTFYKSPTITLFEFDAPCGAQGQNGGQIPEEMLRPKLATLDPATGALTLNIGAHRGDRALQKTATGESVKLYHVSGSPDDPGGETIKIMAFGATDEYSGVKWIIFDGDNSDETVWIDDAVLAPSFLNGGTGNETLKAGGGAAIIDGGDGNDAITGSLLGDVIIVGAGNAVVDARGGDNNITITGGGTKQITGGSGHDTVSETGDVDFTLDGDTLTGLGTATLSGIESVQLVGGGGANTFIVSAWNGEVVMNGLGGNDVYIIDLVGLGETDYIVADPSGDDTVRVNGTDFEDELLVEVGRVTSGDERVLFFGVENLIVDGGAGRDRINARATAEGMTTRILGGADGDLIRVSSRAGDDDDGDLDGIQGTLWIDAGGGGANRLVVSNYGGVSAEPIILRTAADGYMAVDRFAPAAIYFKADGGAFFEFPAELAVNMEGYDPDYGVILRGSNTSDDEFRIRATAENATTKVEGNGGHDTLIVSATDLSQPGGLGGILGALTLDGGLGAFTDGTPGSNQRGLISLDRAIVIGDADFLLRDALTRFKDGTTIPDGTAAEAILSATPAGSGVAIPDIRLRSVETAELRGGPSGDRMDGLGFSGSLILRGGAGNDVLIGGSGDNDIDGGEGDNVLYAGTDRFAKPGLGSQHRVILGGGGTSTLRGGGSGRNTFYADLNGSATLIGGSGDNLYVVTNPADGVIDPVAGVTIVGAGKPGDVLRLVGGGGAGYNQTYLLGPTPGAGNIVTTNNHVPDGPTISQFLRFSGLARIEDSIAADHLVFLGESAAAPIDGITSADLAAGVVKPTVGGRPFGEIVFSNKSAPMAQFADGQVATLPPPPAPLAVAPAPVAAPAPAPAPPIEAPPVAAPAAVTVAAPPAPASVVVETQAPPAEAAVAAPVRPALARLLARRRHAVRPLAARQPPARRLAPAFAAPRFAVVKLPAHRLAALAAPRGPLGHLRRA